MELLERYIKLLRFCLPRDQREDVAREISEEIREHLRDREAALGRRLTAGEQAELIAPYGHPLVTAARYRPQRHLIGPVVFPYYWMALKAALALTAVGQAISLAVALSDNASGLPLREAFEGTVQNAFAVIAWLTILAVAAERWLVKSRALQRWNPRTPPRRPRPGSRGAAGLVLAMALGSWWLLALKHPLLMFGPGASYLDWGPDMHRLYPVLALGTGVFLAGHAAKLSRLRQHRLLRVVRGVGPIVGALFALGVVTSHNQWVVWSSPAAPAAVNMGGLVVPLIDFVNLAFGVPFGLAAVVTVLSLIRRVYRWSSGSGNGGMHSAPAV